LYWLALNLPGTGMLQTVSLVGGLITAATGSLVFLYLVRMGFSPITAVGAPLIFGLATIAAVYAKYLFSEPLAGFLLLLTAYMLFVYRQEGGLRHVAIAGLAAGFAVLTRANNLFLVPIFVLYLLWLANQRDRTSAAAKPAESHRKAIGRGAEFRSYLYPLLTFMLALALPGLILLAYNALRSGNPLQTGYDLTLFSPNVLVGLYKLLFSPLRGLFVYSPIILFSLPGWWLLRKAYPAEAWLIAGLVVVTLVLFSAWSSGEGLSWGSRFLVPLVPFFVVSLAPMIELLTASRMAGSRTYQAPRLRLHLLRLTFYGLLTISIAIQILGVTINPWVFLARMQAEFGGEFFLENTAALYDFRYSQIAGQLRSWSPDHSDLAWWQPRGFDGLALGLSVALVLGLGWLFLVKVIVRQDGGRPAGNPVWPPRIPASFHLSLAIVAAAGVTYLLLARYYRTDLQFGPPGDAYTAALEAISAETTSLERIMTVAPYHYHVPMNRFKARVPLIGFAQQVAPVPETALPLLRPAGSIEDIWLVTVGFPPAALDNAAEQWLAHNTHKISDDWRPDQVRIARFSLRQPNRIRPVGILIAHEVELVKAGFVDSANPGDVLPVELTWLAITSPTNDYKTFVQLLDLNGNLVAQHDAPPQGGYAPTSAWQTGQEITSRHGLLLPDTLAPGNYRLIGGLYDPTTGQRLMTDSAADSVELGPIVIIDEFVVKAQKAQINGQ
jgi:hypothetical protein